MPDSPGCQALEAVFSRTHSRRRRARIIAECRLHIARALGRSKVHVMERGISQGLRFCPGPSDPAYASGSSELPVQNALRDLLGSGDVFYDVGANVGFFSVAAAKLVGPEGAVVAFEPVPINLAYLLFNCRLNQLHNVMCVDVAVGASNAEETLLLAQHSGGSTLESAGAPPDLVGRMRVPTVTLDDWCLSGRSRSPSVVKIDVEGAEAAVLSGMHDLLSRKHVKIVLEVDGPDTHTMERQFGVCRDRLEAYGYDVHVLPNSYPNVRWFVLHAVAIPKP